MSITYITGNYGKYISVKNSFNKYGLDLDYVKVDIDELEVSSVEEVSLDKAIKAYNIVGKPCFVQDSGFYIYGYPDKENYPGTLVKRSGISNDIEGLLETMKDVDNRGCTFVTSVTYYDGVNVKQFLSYSPGVLTREKRGVLPDSAWSRLWEVFIPEGFNKTLAEMTDEERSIRNASRKSAVDLFLEWYKEKDDVKKLIKK